MCVVRVGEWEWVGEMKRERSKSIIIITGSSEREVGRWQKHNKTDNTWRLLYILDPLQLNWHFFVTETLCLSLIFVTYHSYPTHYTCTTNPDNSWAIHRADRTYTNTNHNTFHHHTQAWAPVLTLTVVYSVGLRPSSRFPSSCTRKMRISHNVSLLRAWLTSNLLKKSSWKSCLRNRTSNHQRTRSRSERGNGCYLKSNSMLYAW